MEPEDMDADDGPPPTPMWRNTPPPLDVGRSTNSVGGGSIGGSVGGSVGGGIGGGGSVSSIGGSIGGAGGSVSSIGGVGGSVGGSGGGVGGSVGGASAGSRSSYSNSTHASAGSGAAGTVQRHWRGLRDRWKVVQRLAWIVSSGLDRIEEQHMLDLSVFLQALTESPQLQLTRKSPGETPFPLPAPLSASAPQYKGEQLKFPLTESTVLDMVSCFCRGQLLPRAFVAELLKRQLALLESLPNVVKFTVPPSSVMCIVGDIHGQFHDLMHIFRSHGFPSPSRPYLFNGDFVDRGECGVEVTLTIFAWQQLYPNHVFLNRGNHEERSVHALYGFLRECTRKYDNGVYELFNECFENLPLATLLNDKVLVLHGGIDDEMSLDTLSRAPRVEYVVNAASGTGAAASGRPALLHPAMRARLPEIEARDAMLKPINSALWNDPMGSAGTLPNKSRGTGLLFGADVAQKFLERNGLGLVVRSHEQVLEGYDWPFGVGKHLATVFSASNYAGKTQNKGAYALLTAPGTSSLPASASAPASATASALASASGSGSGSALAPASAGKGSSCTVQYKFGLLRFVQFEAEHIPSLKVQQRNQHLLNSLIFAKRAELSEAYSAADAGGTGRVPVAVWASETKEVLQVPFSLMPMRQQLLGKDHAASMVDYAAFLKRFRLARPQLEPFYPLREYLLALMYKVDSEATGSITLKEFNTVCRVLHRQLESGSLCANPTEVLAAIGPVGQRAHETGMINISEVADQFRILVPDSDTPPTLVELLHRLDRDDIQAVARSPERRGSQRAAAADTDEEMRCPDSPPHGSRWSDDESASVRMLQTKGSLFLEKDDSSRSELTRVGCGSFGVDSVEDLSRSVDMEIQDA